jgi:hypothetical protein
LTPHAVSGSKPNAAALKLVMAYDKSSELIEQATFEMVA